MKNASYDGGCFLIDFQPHSADGGTAIFGVARGVFDWRVYISPVTASKNMTIAKSFFEFAESNEWIARNPARLVKDVRGQAGAKEPIPFSDDELKRMFEACETKYAKEPIRWSRNTHHHEAVGETANYEYRWNGQDLADFISVSRYTGLRISDARCESGGRAPPCRSFRG